ncbi:hypothetical protein ACE939_01730 [Aquimarina sp. W85]|uniref:hypothetical protein n=1 Tax=Aquimarina rhodophyticola TaxID=3342246 RepID=UPI00366AD5DC
MKNAQSYLHAITYKLSMLCILFYTTNLVAQSTDLARIEYANIPQADSKNLYSRFRFMANIPFKLNEKGAYLVVGTQYRLNTLDIQDGTENLQGFNKSGLDDFHTIGLELGYTFKMSEIWRFGAKFGTRLSSNIENNNLETDDFRYTISSYFIRSKKGEGVRQPSRLILGFQFTYPSSINFPLPIVNYYKKFHPKWSYAVGTPKTNIKHLINDKNTIQLFASLDRFYGNIQRNRSFIDQDGIVQVAENVSMLTILGAVGYEHFFTKHILFYAYGGYTLSNEIRLRNGDQENILTINDKNTFYLRSGIKLKI